MDYTHTHAYTEGSRAKRVHGYFFIDQGNQALEHDMAESDRTFNPVAQQS